MEKSFYCDIWNYWRSIEQEDMRHEWQSQVYKDDNDLNKRLILLREYHEKYPDAIDITWDLVESLYGTLQFSEALKLAHPLVLAYPDDLILLGVYYLILSEVFLTLSENTVDKEDKEIYRLKHVEFENKAEEANQNFMKENNKGL